ncbi:EAL domain-containing protein [Demequina sp. TTPB684]|uniref:putative bifunctional diguanylate cyclase/phosphodiesterase n=1 Tax=unclassified Demequina TaxID=2620311 RepID=UPI001CF5C42F|nr:MULTISPECIES: EAL domain-containing protein [unclassified Demequina]MCB2411572.1 EAL domain-containing protein [Demequina sp. TTPB684]UPU87198.1 EAL domain-containing protein [Demequina sp. TMPB413]
MMPKSAVEVADTMAEETTLDKMIEPCRVVDATTTCAQVDEEFAGQWQGSSLLVRAADGSIGLLGRAAFLSRMAGRYGYGRSLWGRRPVAAVATWGVPVVRSSTTTVHAASLIVDSAQGYRDLPVVDDDGEPIGIVRPIRVMRALAEQTAQRAATDELTGAASRARLIEGLDERLARVAAGDGAVAVAFLDLDRLKPVNDLYGHTMGDALLKSVARRLAGAIGPHHLLGRLGGDEFAVVMSLEPAPQRRLEEEALALGERLRAALAQPDPVLPTPAESRASIGVTVASGAGVRGDQLLKAADEAMYTAKVAGGDRVRLGGAFGGVRHSLPTEDLVLVYQPFLDLETGRVTAVEALLRARQPDGCLEFPAERMQQVARAGAALELDRWVLSQACAAMVRWTASADIQEPPRIHVNLAPESVSAPSLADVVLETVDESGVERDRVCLELSEYVGVADLVRATPQLATLAVAGIRLALDDIGATLGALRMIGTSLPIECIKVDRSVIEGCGRDAPFDVEMLALVARLADRFRLDVVAEGIETDVEDDAVRRSGIHQVQGFLHSRPLTEEDLMDFVSRRHGAGLGA